MITGARLKAEGVRPGIPDLMLVAPRGKYKGLFIEMKKPPNHPNDDQKKVISYLDSQGYCCLVKYNAETAITSISSYLGGFML